MSIDYRRTLIAATVAQAMLVVHSEHDGASCAVIGVPIRISKDHVMLFIVEGSESIVPLKSIRKVELIKARDDVAQVLKADEFGADPIVRPA